MLAATDRLRTLPGRENATQWRTRMAVSLFLLAILGGIGAFDTIYYHELRAQLPAQSGAEPELKLHSLRDFIYAILFGTLGWLEWHGICTIVLAGLLVAEIALTLADFVIEIRVRKPIGDVYAGERVTHAIMGILYGSFLAFFIPVLSRWWLLPTGLARTGPVQPVLRPVLGLMALGVCLSGIRDLAAAYGLPHSSWPWTDQHKDFRIEQRI